MSNPVNYAIVQKETGSISVNSHVKSFGLDHVTEKDILSFYTNFSQFAAFDTGLLPVSDNGILAIRTAGEHTQFAYQHAPGCYHVNWGDHEGQSTANVYYLAQPYRIIICDMYKGNLYGARTFYSPSPIVSPDQPLYNVNLPNINCYGYRGNGVGWICLYHTQDWSDLPFNEKIIRFIERCSGVETYNYANMSETDGVRLYRENKPSQQYLYNPEIWQEKTQEEGYAWTLDPHLWIPVLVLDKHNQDKNYPNGQPLTIADALTGTYASYYDDKFTQKPINRVINLDMEMDSKEVLSMFVKAYSSSAVIPKTLSDPYSNFLDIKDKVGSTEFKDSILLNPHEEESFICANCTGTYYEPKQPHFYDADESPVCYDCEDAYAYVESVDSYYHKEDDRIFYSAYDDTYYHSEVDHYKYCNNCGVDYGANGNEVSFKDFKPPVYTFFHEGKSHTYCDSCKHSFVVSTPNVTLVKCDGCYKSYVLESSEPVVSISLDPDLGYASVLENFCPTCADSIVVCPCGYKSSTQGTFKECAISLTGSEDDIKVYKTCASCVTDTGEFKSVFPEAHQFTLQSSIVEHIAPLPLKYDNDDDDSPF